MENQIVSKENNSIFGAYAEEIINVHFKRPEIILDHILNNYFELQETEPISKLIQGCLKIGYLIGVSWKFLQLQSELIDGRNISKQTPEEVQKLLKRDVRSLSPEEMEVMQLIMAEMTGGKTGLLELMNELEFQEPMVDIETWLTDPYHFGKVHNLWPKLIDDMIEMFNGEYYEVIMTGSLGYGKISESDKIRMKSKALIRVQKQLPISETTSYFSDGILDPTESLAFCSFDKPKNMQIQLEDGRKLLLTPGQEVLTNRGSKQASELFPNEDLIKTFDEVNDEGTFVLLSSVKEDSTIIPKGNISSLPPSTYYANGICVHSSVGLGGMTGDMEIIDYKTGMRLRLDEAVNKEHILIASADPKGNIILKKANVHFLGSKECWKYTFNSGIELNVTSDQMLRNRNGFANIYQVANNEAFFASARCYPDKIDEEVSDSEIKMLAYLLTDGSTTQGTRYTKGNPVLLEEVKQLTNELSQAKNNKIGRVLVKKNCTELGLNGMKWFCEKYQLKHKSKDKRIPALCYGWSNRQLALFLNRIYTSDGNISINPPQLIEIGLASNAFINDIQVLLRKLGIISNKCYMRKSNQSGKYFDSWRLGISDSTMITKFLETVGYLFGQEGKSESLYNISSVKNGNANLDIVPISYYDLDFYGRGKYNADKKQKYGQKRFKKIAVFAPGYKYSWLANNELYWMSVKKVTNLAVQNIYGVSVEDGNNAIVNNMVIKSLIIS